jgi:hypothetical protein
MTDRAGPESQSTEEPVNGAQVGSPPSRHAAARSVALSMKRAMGIESKPTTSVLGDQAF